jgi:hypothetical protein
VLAENLENIGLLVVYQSSPGIPIVLVNQLSSIVQSSSGDLLIDFNPPDVEKACPIKESSGDRLL